MKHICKSISYDWPDPMGMPTFTAELVFFPETRRDYTNIEKALYSRNYEDVTKLGLAFNSRPTLPSIKNVYFNPPATVVLWNDGTKTVVKCQDGDAYSKETGLALCMAKKAMGNKGNFNDIFRKWIPEETTEEDRFCSNCKYAYSSDYFEPCDSCDLFTHSNWESAR